MACFHPIQAYRRVGGGATFRRRDAEKIPGGLGPMPLPLPCGRCIGCRIDRSRQWAVRCVHEATEHDDSEYVTLTYDDDNIPHGHNLHYPDFQGFMKRMRAHFGPIRFYMCGEYGSINEENQQYYAPGETLGRPHYHALLYGLRLPDRRLHKIEGDNSLFTSKILTKKWGKGHCLTGAVTFQSAAYVARYIMKKIGGDPAEEHYKRIVPETGEIVQLEPEFTHMSLKPGIGATWFDRLEGDVFPDDFVVIGGRRYKTPRFYDILFRRKHGEEALEQFKEQRRKHAESQAEHNTPERLSVREKVLEARVSRLKRTLS